MVIISNLVYRFLTSEYFTYLIFEMQSSSSGFQINDPVDADELFKKIRHIRNKLQLQKLAKNKTLEIVAEELIQNETLAPIDERKMNYVTLSILSILDTFKNESTEQLIDRWLADANKRPVVLGVGNYAALHIEYDNEEHSSGKVALIVAMIYRPKQDK
ncbi:hypothetical protein TRFO_05682 [Tritrichomonas foetus]|uniref:SCP domain-containing protein n=1 Tax=Tritrichomonas foetus TaxID=1144522 RepID=A0A1J4K3L8_9EUKA|nr:hypothetical protein TRFO_05682 [Tritrichomonas foetus]|eukprot:OHT06041.1 hypothetical protein TRFO_05682 [Tritrichomonas foetus]